MNWFRGFFENGQPQSMSDGLAFLCVIGGLFYGFIHVDAVSGVAIITVGLGLKGHKNYESRKRKNNNLDIERIDSDSIHNESRD